MSVNVGTYSIGKIYVGTEEVVEAYVGSNLVFQGLPTKTFRFRFSNVSFNPSTTLASSNLTWTLVDSSRGLWDAISIQAGDTPYSELFSTLLSSTNMGSITCSLVAANTTGMTSAYNLFRGCNALTNVCKMDFSSCTNIRYLFDSCTNLLSVPLFDFHNVTNAGNAFSSCSSLTSVPNFDLSSLQQANYMFSGCLQVTEFPDWQLNNLVTAAYMFTRCSSLTKVPNFGQLPNISGVNYMFQNCSLVESGALALYNILSTRITTASRYTACFRNCGASTTTGAAELAQIPSGWK